MRSISPSSAQKASPTSSPSGPSICHCNRSRDAFFDEVEEWLNYHRWARAAFKANGELSLRFSSRGRHGSHFLASRALNAGGFTLQIAQVIQPCPANFTFADDFNRADRGRVQRENAFDAHAKTDPAHRKGGAGRPALLGDHHTLECLEALLHLLAFAFLQAHVDAYGIARAELGQVFAQLRFM